jgi:hypothetical protein
LAEHLGPTTAFNMSLLFATLPFHLEVEECINHTTSLRSVWVASTF